MHMQRIRSNLGNYILKWALTGFCIAGCCLFILYRASYSLAEMFLVSTTYISDSEKPAIDEFQKYVDDNEVRAGDYETICKWVNGQKLNGITISGNRTTSISKDGILLLDSGGENSFSFYNQLQTYSKLNYLVNGFTFSVRFSDGSADVFVDTGAADRLYKVILSLDVFICALVWICFLLYACRKIVNRILLLDKEISSQDLSGPITIRGQDELSHLAMQVKESRRKLKENWDTEKKLMQQQKTFMTGITHDLRSPMTAVLSYLSLSKNARSVEEAQQFIRPAYEKMLELRELSNEVFDYLLLGSRTEVSLEGPELISSALGDALSEFIFLLGENGFSADTENLHFTNCSILFHPPYVSRIMSNILSNIEKYAAPGSEIALSLHYTQDAAVLSVRNAIYPEKAGSHGAMIGVNNIREMMRLMHGSVTIEEDEGKGIYCISLFFPINSERGNRHDRQ